MKHQCLIAAIGSFFTFAITCEAQTVAKSGEPGRLSPVRQGSANGKLAAPVAPAATPEKRAKGPTEITAREATFDNRAHFAIFTGDVVVKDPEFNVTCDQMTVYLKKPPEKDAPPDPQKPAANPTPEGDTASGIDRAIAEGNVIITQDKPDADGKPQHYVGTGRKAVFENATGNVTLYGWPQVSQRVGGSLSKKIVSLVEGCVIVMNRAGKIDVNGLHTTTLQDSGAVDRTPR